MHRSARLVGSLALAFIGCRHPSGSSPHGRVLDASSPRMTIDAAVPLPAFGPPNPWGDGGIPPSTATGPEAEATRASLSALRASIGFWRVARNLRDHCPTLADLAATPASAFDPTTMGHDAWGHAFEIDCQGARVRLRSAGPDGVRDTADDLFSE